VDPEVLLDQEIESEDLQEIESEDLQEIVPIQGGQEIVLIQGKVQEEDLQSKNLMHPLQGF